MGRIRGKSILNFKVIDKRDKALLVERWWVPFKAQVLIFCSAKNTQDHQWYLSLTFDKCKMFLGAPQLLIMGEYLDSVNQNERVWGQPKKKIGQIRRSCVLADFSNSKCCRRQKKLIYINLTLSNIPTDAT